MPSLVRSAAGASISSRAAYFFGSKCDLSRRRDMSVRPPGANMSMTGNLRQEQDLTRLHSP